MQSSSEKHEQNLQDQLALHRAQLEKVSQAQYDTKAKTYIQRQSPSGSGQECFTPLFEYSGSQTLAALLHGFGDDFVGTQKSIVTCEVTT